MRKIIENVLGLELGSITIKLKRGYMVRNNYIYYTYTYIYSYISSRFF